MSYNENVLIQDFSFNLVGHCLSDRKREREECNDSDNLKNQI